MRSLIPAGRINRDTALSPPTPALLAPALLGLVEGRSPLGRQAASQPASQAASCLLRQAWPQINKSNTTPFSPNCDHSLSKPVSATLGKHGERRDWTEATTQG